MVFIFVYSIIIIMFISFHLCTKKYKKDIFDNVCRKENPFRFMYGMSGWIIDFINKRIYRIPYKKIHTKLEKINVNNHKKSDAYIYIVSRLSASIVAFIIIIIFGDIICVNNMLSGSNEVKSILRSDYGDGEKTYNLEVKFNNGYRQNVKINLPERRYSDDDINNIFEKCYDYVIKDMLNGNESVDNITDDINLIYNTNDNVTIDWNLNNTEYIDYSGKINWDKMGDVDKVCLEIEAIFSLDNQTKKYVIELTLNKSGRDRSKLINNIIEEYINDYPEIEKEVTLMNKIDNEEVTFRKKVNNSSSVYIFIGFIMAFTIYAAKSKELQNIEEKRKKQLEIDYVAVVNKITILHSAGMTILSAWDKIISDYEKNKNITGMRYAYEEMKLVRYKMKNGYSECQAYIEYGNRCGIHSYVKLGNLLEQNIKKGTKGLTEILEYEVNDAYEERKALAKKKGEEAGTKLLLPMGIMLIISMAVIIIPAFLSMNL